VLGRAIIVRDISDRELVEQELQRAKESAEAANRAKTGFLTSVGHELRAPLRTITGYSDTLLAEATEQGLKTFPGYLEQIS
jgi:signal transduction histidine kinase